MSSKKRAWDSKGYPVSEQLEIFIRWINILCSWLHWNGMGIFVGFFFFQFPGRAWIGLAVDSL